MKDKDIVIINRYDGIILGEKNLFFWFKLLFVKIINCFNGKYKIF